ncbi:MAG: PAS domain-containing protein [Actinomycetota bacterium]
MATERDRTPVADDAADRLAEMIEPGSLLEATPECLVVTRADGRILFANRRVAQLTGFDRDELVGRSVELLVAADILDLELGSRVEAVCRTSTGGDVPVEVHMGRIDGSEQLLIITLRDASDLQAAARPGSKRRRSIGRSSSRSPRSSTSIRSTRTPIRSTSALRS